MKQFIAYLTAILFTIVLSMTITTILYNYFQVPDLVCSIVGFLLGWNMPKFVIKQLLPEDKEQQ
jgi:hypothetical protein